MSPAGFLSRRKSRKSRNIFGASKMALIEELDVGGMVDGDDKDTDMLEGDDEGAVLVDALDGALDALEITTDKPNAATFVAKDIIIIGYQRTTVLLVEDLPGLHELAHAGLLNGDNRRTLLEGACLEGHILHRGTVGTEHLEMGQGVDAGIDKDEVVDNRLHGPDNLLVLTLEDLLHGDVVLDMLVVEGLLDSELTAIGDIHGKPVDLVSGNGATHR